MGRLCHGITAALLVVALALAPKRAEARDVSTYEIAQRLYELGYLHSAYALFSDIAEQRAHPRRAAALYWLAALASVLPEPADVGARLALYDDDELAKLDGAETHDVAARVALLVAQHDYRGHQYERAARRLASIDALSREYASAQLWLGITNVRLRKSAPAIEAYRRVTLLQSPRRIEPRLRDLARMSIARTLYSASLHLDENNSPTIEQRTFSAAVAQYRLIEPESELWLEAQLEVAWAYFMAGDAERALGALFSLETPYFPDAWLPEAEMLRIVIHFAACDYDTPDALALQMQSRYLPIQNGLQILLRTYDDDADAFVAFLISKRDASATLEPTIARPVRHALRDRRLLRALRYVEELTQEMARLRNIQGAERANVLADDTLERLRIRRAGAAMEAATEARELLRHDIEDLTEYLRFRMPRFSPSLDSGALTDGLAPQRKKVTVTDGEIAWPFNGEYWRDELGTYRVPLGSRCGRYSEGS